MDLKKGTLWQSVQSTSERALRSGALLPLATDHAYIEDGGITFFVRVLARLRKKDEARREQDAAARAGRSVNPFLPPERELTVSDISPTHVVVLNKFNVVDHHLLIITREFEDQDSLLTIEDFEALWTCMEEYHALGFYNGGREAGASQQHKHLQMVPLPLSPRGPAVPIEPLLAGTAAGIGRIPCFPFLHALTRTNFGPADSPRNAALETFKIYAEMLRSVGMRPPSEQRPEQQSMPYCLLISREWMLLVPRSTEFFEDISFNSLAFAGSFFVRDEEQLGRLRSVGPLQALKQVCIPL